VRVQIIAVQTEIKPEHYLTPQAFAARVDQLCAAATEHLPTNEPRILAFPEAFALPLLFWLETPPEVRGAKTSLEAALTLLKLHWREALCLKIPSPSVIYHLRAPVVWPVYQQTFEQAALKHRAYIVAGSLFSPQMDWEPSRQLHREGWRVYNVSLVVSPQGKVLSRVPKINLTAHERGAFLSGGPFGPQVIRTQLGRIANLICLDAFHDNLIEQADGAGAWLVVQPSANAGAWDGPWSGDPGQNEGAVWLREGLAKKLVGRENLHYGLNPMLNGKLYDLEFEGRSAVYKAGEILAIAERPVGDAVVVRSVEI
jgi:predicted amidohydrolase